MRPGLKALLSLGVMAFAEFAKAETRGVIDDPKGCDLRAEQRSDAAIVAKVKGGEPFTFHCEKNGEWCKVTLATGETGWIEESRIRFYYTEKDLPVQEKKRSANLSEIDSMARARGFDYAVITR